MTRQDIIDHINYLESDAKRKAEIFSKAEPWQCYIDWEVMAALAALAASHEPINFLEELTRREERK